MGCWGYLYEADVSLIEAYRAGSIKYLSQLDSYRPQASKVGDIATRQQVGWFISFTKMISQYCPSTRELLDLLWSRADGKNDAEPEPVVGCGYLLPDEVGSLLTAFKTIDPNTIPTQAKEEGNNPEIFNFEDAPLKVVQFTSAIEKFTAALDHVFKRRKALVLYISW